MYYQLTLTLLLCLFSATSYAQTSQKVNTPTKQKKLATLEEFRRHIVENLKYPEKALQYHVEGRVFVQFTVEKDGKITHVKLIKGIGYGCDEEALRLVRSAPSVNYRCGCRYTPPQRITRSLVVKFTLPEKEEEETHQ